MEVLKGAAEASTLEVADAATLLQVLQFVAKKHGVQQEFVRISVDGQRAVQLDKVGEQRLHGVAQATKAAVAATADTHANKHYMPYNKDSLHHVHWT